MNNRASIPGFTEAQQSNTPAINLNDLGNRFYAAAQYPYALECFMAAAALDHPEAICSWALMQHYGTATSISLPEAEVKYLRAIGLGNGFALTLLGKLYYEKGLYQKALEKFEIALTKENNTIIERYNYFYLAPMYEYGYGVKKDISKACYFYQRAYEAGYTEALAKITHYGRKPHSQILGFSAAKGDGEALYKLGKQNVSDLPSALSCYDAAVQLNNHEALYALWHHYRGNPKIAEAYLQRLYKVNVSNPEIIVSLGNIAYNKNNMEDAINYYEEGLINKSSKAIGNLGSVYFQARDYESTYLALFLSVLLRLKDDKEKEVNEQAILYLMCQNDHYPNISLYLYSIYNESEKIDFAKTIIEKVLNQKSLPVFYKNYFMAMQAKANNDFITAIKYLEATHTRDPHLSAWITLELARTYKKVSDYKAKALTAYKNAYIQGINSLIFRKLVMLRVEACVKENINDKDFKVLLVDLNYREAEIQYNHNKIKIAKHYIEIAVNRAKEISNEFLENADDLNYLHARIQAESQPTEAFNLVVKLANKNHLNALSRLAEVHLSGLLGQVVNIKACLAVYNTLLPLVFGEECDNALRDKIEKGLIRIHAAVPQYHLEVNEMIFKILTAESWVAKKTQLANCLSTSSVEQHRDIALDVMRKTLPSNPLAIEETALSSLTALFKQKYMLGPLLLLNAISDITRKSFIKKYLSDFSSDEMYGDLQKAEILKAFLLRCLNDSGTPYHLPTLKNTYPTLQPLMLILLALSKAIENMGPIGIGDKLGTDPGLIDTDAIISKNIKLILKEHLQVTAELVDEIYAKIKSDLKLLSEIEITPAISARSSKSKSAVINETSEISRAYNEHDEVSIEQMWLHALSKTLIKNGSTANFIKDFIYREVYKMPFTTNCRNHFFISRVDEVAKMNICLALQIQITHFKNNKKIELSETLIKELSQNEKLRECLEENYRDFCLKVESDRTNTLDVKTVTNETLRP